MILLDYRLGSKELATIEPTRSLLAECNCHISNKTSKLNKPKSPKLDCKQCYGTGRILDELSSGDIAICGNGPNGPIMIGIEFKNISDLLQSIYSGRLQDTQLGAGTTEYGMLNDYAEVWILAYGRYRLSPRDNKTLQIYKEKFTTKSGQHYNAGFYDCMIGGDNSKFESYRYLESFLCSQSILSRNIHIKHVEDINQAANWIKILHDNRQRPYNSHRSMLALDRSQSPVIVPGLDEVERLMLAIASDLPGIRDKRAYAAVEHFDSVYDMITADKDEWNSVNLIGNVLSRSVYDIIRKKKKSKEKSKEKSQAKEIIKNDNSKEPVLNLLDIVRSRSNEKK